MDSEKKYTMLEAMIELAPIIQKLCPLDVAITVTDTEKFVAQLNTEELQLKDVLGKPVPPQSGMSAALSTGEIQSNVLPKEIYGMPFKTINVPVKDYQGKVFGCFGLGVSLKNQETLNDAIQSFASTSEEVIAATQELAASAQDLALGMDTINAIRQEMEVQVEKTKGLLTFIKKIADNSNLLGLNASIEAARVGQAGRGFEVVATEIRKMAESSTKSVEEIGGIVEAIKKKMQQISEEVPKVLEFSQHQAASSEEIAASMSSLTTHLDDIEEIARRI